MAPLDPRRSVQQGAVELIIKTFPLPPNPKKDLMFKSVTPEER